MSCCGDTRASLRRRTQIAVAPADPHPGGAPPPSRVRARLGDSQAGALMDCFQCTSVWVAAPLSASVVQRRRHAPVAWLALSGAACLLERLTDEDE